MIVTTAQHQLDKRKFFEEHPMAVMETSPINQYGEYHKTYFTEDGEQWIECMRPVYESVEVEVRMTQIPVNVKLLETEYWSTIDSRSKKCYERF